MRSKVDIEKVTRIPVAGISPHSKYENNLVVLNKPKSSVSEAFRALRSNLKFITREAEAGKAQILAVTSSIGGEGKTFMAINLASVLSLGEQKVSWWVWTFVSQRSLTILASRMKRGCLIISRPQHER